MRYLLCSNSGSGFVQTTIGLAQTLARRGHAVAVVADVSAAADLAAAGIERIPRGVDDGPSFEIPKWGQPLAIAIQVKHLEYAVARFAPDALVGQPLTLGAFLVRERRQLPLAVLGLATYLLPRRAASFDDPAATAAERRVAWRYNGMLETYARLRQLYRLPPVSDNPVESLLLGDQFLLQSVPELLPPGPPLPARVRFVGACQRATPAADPEIAAWLDDARARGRAVLYVQPGRTFDQPRFWTALLEALAGRAVSVVAAVERLDGPLGELPPNVLARPLVDQTQVLPYAQAVVCGGNSTATLGALQHGRPLLIMPAGGEQQDVAEMCATAGVARVCEPAADAATLGAALDAVLADPTLHARAAVIAAAFTATPGFARAADAVEQLTDGISWAAPPPCSAATEQSVPAALAAVRAVS